MRWRAVSLTGALLAAAASIALTTGTFATQTDQGYGYAFVVTGDPAHVKVIFGTPPPPPGPPPVPPPVVYRFAPTATDLDAEPFTTLAISDRLGALAHVADVPQRHRPTGRTPTAAETAIYHAAIGRLRHASYRAVQASIPGTFGEIIDHQLNPPAIRSSGFAADGTLTVQAVGLAGQTYLPASANAAGPDRGDLTFPAHAWLWPGPTVEDIDLDSLDPFRTNCADGCRLTVLPTVHGVRHFLVETASNGDGSINQEGADVEVTGGIITAFYNFEPGDGGGVYDTDVPQFYTVLAPLPTTQPITAPGASLILDPGQVQAAAARALAVERAADTQGPTTDPSCPPGTATGTECVYIPKP